MQYFFYKQFFFLYGFCFFLYPILSFAAAPKESCLKARIAALLQMYPQNELGKELRSVFPETHKIPIEFNHLDNSEAKLGETKDALKQKMVENDLRQEVMDNGAESVLSPELADNGIEPGLNLELAKDDTEPGFWNQVVEQVKKADEFYNKRIKPEGGNNKIRWFRPNIIHFDGFQWALGNTVNYRTNISDLKTLALYYTYSPLQLKSPFSALKMHSIDFGFVVQDKISKRWFSRVGGGVRRFVPNQAYRDFYATVGQSFDNESIPYLSFGFGYTIVENLFKMNRSLVWFAGYTMAEDFHYPSADPFGYLEIKLQGFFHGFSFSYKF